MSDTCGGISELTWRDVDLYAADVAAHIKNMFPTTRCLKMFPVPNGGIPAAQAVQNVMIRKYPTYELELTDSLVEADLIIDDIVDTGRTKGRILSTVSATGAFKPFYSLITKDLDAKGKWVSFPWERMQNKSGPEDNITRLLQYIGEDPKREGLLDTPKRVVKAFNELYSGYKQDPTKLLTTFGHDGYDEMVVLKDVEFVSSCEHHMLPFIGKATIAYLPDGKVIGISKLARMFEIYCRRLQIQERLCQQVTSALDTHLKPKGSACLISAQHMCMVCRGVKKQNSIMITSSLTGLFKEDAKARSEFLDLAR